MSKFALIVKITKKMTNEIRIIIEFKFAKKKNSFQKIIFFDPDFKLNFILL